MAGNAAQLHGSAQERHASDRPDRIVGRVAEVLRGYDAHGPQLGGQAASDAPHLLHRQPVEDLRRIVRHDEHSVRTLLADVVRDLGERLRRREADSARNADPAEDLLAEPSAVRGVVSRGRGRRKDERLVD